MLDFIIAFCIVALLILLIVRAALFRPWAQEKSKPETVKIDKEKAAQNLSQLIAKKTVALSVSIYFSGKNRL